MPTTTRSGDETAGASTGAAVRRSRHLVRWVVLLVGGGLFVPFLFVLGSRIGRDPTLVRSPLLGKPAPAFDLPRLDRPGRLSSQELSGGVYVVNFWASWCIPCREETPVLESFYQRWRPRGVELVGILHADKAGAAREFRDELGGSWPVVNDPKGRTAIDFGVFGVPETYVIDGRGLVMAKLVGAIGPTTLDDVLARLEAGGSPVSNQNDRYRTSPEAPLTPSPRPAWRRRRAGPGHSGGTSSPADLHGNRPTPAAVRSRTGPDSRRVRLPGLSGRARRAPEHPCRQP